MALIIKHFDNDSIADSGTFSGSWTADADYTIKYFFVKRKDGAAFTESTITVRIDNVPMTKDVALCSTFGTDILNGLPVNWDLPKDSKIEYSGTNSEGSTVSIAVELVLERK